jgi:ion channel-forming bestrophin family protein
MIQYDPHHWRSHLFDVKGSMVREIFARIAICVVWSAIVVVIHEAGQTPAMTRIDPDGSVIISGESQNVLVFLGRLIPITIPLHGHTLIGAVLGLLLVFRTNASYDRFWEGRKLWGGIVNDSRNLGRLASTLLREDLVLLRQLLRWAMVFPWSVRYRLLGWKDIGCDTDDLPKSDVKLTEQAEHVPLAVARRLTEQIETARQRGLLSDIQQSLFDNLIGRLIDAVGACERIHNTPLPFAYMVHLRRALILYLTTMPLAIVKDFGWATIPATLLISYVMLGIEEIGVEIEDPFGTDENDLPLKPICENIENNLRGLLPPTAETPK